MTLIDGDRIVTAQLYDDEHEEFTEKKMSIIDFVNAYTDEGVTTADDVINRYRYSVIKAIEEKAKRIKNEDTLNGLAGAVSILLELPFPKEHERKFEEIMVEYPPAELCTYPEYRGKPYFSIKYEENGEHIVGFGTYKPEVFSRYIREYFIAPTIIEADKAEMEGDKE